jgi:hypothetical protein
LLAVTAQIDLPEHHWDPACALANAPPGGFHLLERGPERRGVAHSRQQPHVDALVGPLAEEIPGHPLGAVPRSVPGHGALLQQRENAVGDDLVGCRML